MSSISKKNEKVNNETKNKKENTTMQNKYQFATKRNTSLIEYIDEVYNGLSARVPIIDGKKNYSLAIGAATPEDADAGLRFLTAAMEACHNKVAMVKDYIGTYQTWATKGLVVDDLIVTENRQVPMNTKLSIAYDLKMNPIADLDELEANVRESLPADVVKTLLTSKVKAYLDTHAGTAVDRVADVSDITTRDLPLSDYLVMCFGNYITAAPEIDGEITMTMCCTTETENGMDANMALWKKALEICNGDPNKTVSYMQKTVLLKNEGIKPTDSVIIKGSEILLCLDIRKAYMGLDEIADLEDLGDVEMAPEVVKQMLVDRVTAILNEASDDEIEEAYDDGYVDGYSFGEMNGYDTGYFEGCNDGQKEAMKKCDAKIASQCAKTAKEAFNEGYKAAKIEQKNQEKIQQVTANELRKMLGL